MKTLTFGEIMLRLEPEGFKRFSQADKYVARYGGAEANVAASLALLGEEVSFCTKLPQNAIADRAIAELKGLGVDTKLIVRGGDRIGIYFSEKGASQRASQVIYDRSGSAINTLTEEEINYDKVLEDVDWFHFTGITSALGGGVLNVLEGILKTAKKKNIKVSCDLNYRAKLWSKKDANFVMSKLLKYVDILIANEQDVADVLIPRDIEATDKNAISVEYYEALGRKILSTCDNMSQVAFTLRESISASQNGWSGILIDRNRTYVSKRYLIEIVDRVGGGDAFGAGLIYATKTGRQEQEIIDFAVAASCLKQTIEGDYNRSSVNEIDKLILGDGSGRIVR